MSELPYDAILWDNDGILVDTEHLYLQATREIMASVGVQLDDDTYREYFLNRSLGAWHLVEAKGFTGGAIAELRARRDRRHTELLDRPGLVIDGAEEVISLLHGRLRMAVVTSAKRVHFERAHRGVAIAPRLEFVLAREDYAQSKPDPEPYLLGVARLEVAPARCLVIEDTERGLTAAKAAGLDCWVIPTDLSRRGNFAHADRVLRTIRDIPVALGLPALGSAAAGPNDSPT